MRVAFPLLLAACPGAWGFSTERVIYFVIDGPRGTEFLEDSTHAHIPGIWNVLRPQGFISHGLYNNGPTQTMSGHAMLGTGAYQDIVNDGTERPYKPLLWEYLRDQLLLPDSAGVIVIDKGKLAALSHSTSEGYGPPDSAVVLGPVNTDTVVVGTFTGYAVVAEPTIAMLCLADVDQIAHTRDWEGYLSAIETADSLAVALWEWIEATPPLAGTTAFIITADHGRHDHDWTQHGCVCHGCRHLPLVALGPDFRAGVEADSQADIWDISTTMGLVLGIDMPLAQGRYLLEMLEGETVPPEAPVVSINVQGGFVVLRWNPVTTDIDGNPEIVSCYRVYRGDEVSFQSDSTSMIARSVPLPIFTDPDSTVVGDPEMHAFYRVDALDLWSNPSTPSNLVGKIDFTLP
jgi:hypothetical protein